MPKSIVDKDMFSNLNLCQWNMVLKIANLSQKEKKISGTLVPLLSLKGDYINGL